MDYNKLLEYRNTHNAFGKLTNCVVTQISERKATVQHYPDSSSLNPAGSVHGGLLFTIADIAAGSAASTYGMHTTTANSSFYYLRPALNVKYITATAEEIKHGKRLMIFDVKVTDQDDVLLCYGTFTCMSLEKEIEIC